MTQGALLAVQQVRQTTTPPGYRMTVRGEVLDPDLAERERMLSWYVEVEVDCRGHRMRQGPITAYRRRNLLGENRVLRAASPVWLAPAEGTGLAEVWRAACDRGFQWPLVAHSEVIRDDTHPVSDGDRAAEQVVAKKDAEPRAAAPGPTAASRALKRPVMAQVEKGKSKPTKAAPTKTKESHEARRGGGYSVQLAAASSEAGARRALDTPAAKLARTRWGAEPHVERAEVKGKVYYRATMRGMSAEEAAQVCASVRPAGTACLVRETPRAPAKPAAKLPQLRPSKK